MAPKVNGSSTIGVKKSTVCTSASSSDETIHSGIVGSIKADQNVRICDSRQPAQHLVQQLWTQFRRSTRRFYVRRQLSRKQLFWHHSFYNHKTMRRFQSVLLLVLAPMIAVAWLAAAARIPNADPRLKNSYRRPPQDGWTYVHLEGSPGEIGFQHGASARQTRFRTGSKFRSWN